jgi:hypothetical protein
VILGDSLVRMKSCLAKYDSKMPTRDQLWLTFQLKSEQRKASNWDFDPFVNEK